MKKLKERKEELVQERGQQESGFRDIQLIQKTLQTAVANVDSILSMKQTADRPAPGKRFPRCRKSDNFCLELNNAV